MKLLEPTTTITDYILAIETLVFGCLMLQSANLQTSGRLWALAFFSTCVAAAAGGTYHGFPHALSPAAAAAIWKVTLYAIGITTLLLLSATAFASFGPRFRGVLIGLAVAQFAFYAYRMAGSGEFMFVILNYVPAMLVILALQVAGIRQGSAGAGWIAGGVLVSFAAAGVQQSGFTIHRHFNFNDLYHVIQMVAMYLLYRGGLLLRDR